MRAQQVVVAREAKPNPAERVAPFSEGTGSESEAATEMKSQRREKKSASATLTLEQMRMAGALAAERQKKQTPAEQTSSLGGSSLQSAKAAALAERQKTETRVEQATAHRVPTVQTANREAVGRVRPTMLESGKQERAASHSAKTEVSGGQVNVPQLANRALRKKEPRASGADSPDGDSAPASAQSASSQLHLTSRDQETKKDTAQAIAKQKAAKGIRPVAHYSYKTTEGKKESVPVITHYYPKRIVYPFAKVDPHIDGKLMQAATIAQERARGAGIM